MCFLFGYYNFCVVLISRISQYNSFIIVYALSCCIHHNVEAEFFMFLPVYSCLATSNMCLVWLRALCNVCADFRSIHGKIDQCHFDEHQCDKFTG